LDDFSSSNISVSSILGGSGVSSSGSSSSLVSDNGVRLSGIISISLTSGEIDVLSSSSSNTSSSKFSPSSIYFKILFDLLSFIFF